MRKHHHHPAQLLVVASIVLVRKHTQGSSCNSKDLSISVQYLCGVDAIIILRKLLVVASIVFLSYKGVTAQSGCR